MDDRQARLLKLIEDAVGKAAYIGDVDEEGQDVEGDADSVEAERTLGQATIPADQVDDDEGAVTEEFSRVLAVYDAAAPAGLRSYGVSRHYRQIRPTEWPTGVRIHYEFVFKRRSVWCELHMENSRAQEIAPVLEAMAGARVGPLGKLLEWDPTWRKVGRLRVQLEWTNSSEEIAQTMVDMIERTRTPITAAISEL
jgi:hypothetical protein